VVIDVDGRLRERRVSRCVDQRLDVFECVRRGQIDASAGGQRRLDQCELGLTTSRGCTRTIPDSYPDTTTTSALGRDTWTASRVYSSWFGPS
jgi:hypothetical protein